MTLLEVCVDTAEGLAAAILGGADRVELCSVLEQGGLTPYAGLMALAGRAPVPVRAMIRPRAGDFVFTAGELEIMLGDIEMARHLLGDGVEIRRGAVERLAVQRVVGLGRHRGEPADGQRQADGAQQDQLGGVGGERAQPGDGGHPDPGAIERDEDAVGGGGGRHGDALLHAYPPPGT